MGVTTQFKLIHNNESSGIYLLVIENKVRAESKKLVLIK